jgi:hypothetical protein
MHVLGQTGECRKPSQVYNGNKEQGILIQKIMIENRIKPYNRKGFLLPKSIKSMAAYRAKVMPDGKYLFRIHDCNTGIRLTGDLNDERDIREAVEKLDCLSVAAKAFSDFIRDNYLLSEV